MQGYFCKDPIQFKNFVLIGFTQLVAKLEAGEMLNGMPSNVCVGNGFIRSERWVNIRVSLDGNRFLFYHFPSNVHPIKTLLRRNG